MEQYKPPTTKLAFQSDKSYHVFLSFRGENVRKTLVDHLFTALSAAGLNVFLDSEKLEKGQIIGLSLERAIERSAIRIPIFSEGYADSTWCLKEAAAMLSTPALIIPLFYHVDPTHVRYPQGNNSPYKESFLKHYAHPDRQPREVVDEWKEALLQICSRSGWSTDIAQGFEALLIKTVVNDLIKTLDRVPLQVAKHPVGMDTVKNVLIQKLNLNSEDKVVKIGIWGIGGIGKTTVAKALYNQIYADFEGASFAFNVRANAVDPRGLTTLQKQILEELTKMDGEVHSVDKGISLFRDRLGGKRVLLILDDVDAIAQLDALVGDWLCPGSRVIITSRNKHILNVAQVPSECIYEMTELEINEGLQLFSWHAFLKASPTPKYQDLSTRIVEACKGHPLSLEVIGSFLYDKEDSTGCWTEVLDNIILNPDIHKRLYLSYSALTDEEKDIFLDIACFFNGEDKTLPIIFWKSLYKMVDSAVLNLSMKLLIKIDDDGVFHMHDHLRDMGWSIAQKEKEGTRLWEDAHLNTLPSTNFFRLRLNGGDLQRFNMMCRPGLCYLDLQNLSIEGMTEDTIASLPPSLICLRLQNCSFATLHSRFVGNIQQLKTMQLRLCHGVELPDTIGSLRQLQYLDLGSCQRLNNLHDSISNLSQLRHLSLRGCFRLNNLPDAIGNLAELQHLDLGVCQSLNSLPDTIGGMSKLHHLNLNGCFRLISLPDSIGNLVQLQHLDLGVCQGLNKLPDTIGHLSQLKYLNLRGCFRLSNLPDTIGNWTQLQYLDLGVCQSLNNLPNTIGDLSELQHLNLQGCFRLNSLPDTIGNLSRLQHLDLEECQYLTSLPDTIGELSQLQYLSLRWCYRLYNLPDTMNKLTQLRELLK
ncbi:hypothetical protein SUGI_0297280 [Cryptomeria japonica]|uniref:disease resistance protein RPV1 n=1 Tax=Cryptomeria japonica TaxID=3369 RepID=UPI0024089C6B|nr:disease resistance protein RPV1 [Cryptomeria japonica]GLJ17169.1 hypothetical protein SUGI_0297280 [Cryptomeria japonica]